MMKQKNHPHVVTIEKLLISLGFKLLVNNFEDVNVFYIRKRLQEKQEKEEFDAWLEQ